MTIRAIRGGPLGMVRGTPVRLELGLEVLRAAKAAGLSLRLWGSMAVEFQSPSFRRLGFHSEHRDIDFAALPSQRSPVLDLLVSLGFDEGRTVHRGFDGGGCIFARNRRGELVEVLFIHDLNERMFVEDVTTVPLWLIGVRLLAVPITDETTYRADDVIAFFLDHSLTKWDGFLNETPLAFMANESGMRVLLDQNFSFINDHLRTLALESESQVIHERTTPIVNAILAASRRPFSKQLVTLDRWGLGVGFDRYVYDSEHWESITDRGSGVWRTHAK